MVDEAVVRHSCNFVKIDLKTAINGILTFQVSDILTYIYIYNSLDIYLFLGVIMFLVN